MTVLTGRNEDCHLNGSGLSIRDRYSALTRLTNRNTLIHKDTLIARVIHDGRNLSLFKDALNEAKSFDFSVNFRQCVQFHSFRKRRVANCEIILAFTIVFLFAFFQRLTSAE